MVQEATGQGGPGGGGCACQPRVLGTAWEALPWGWLARWHILGGQIRGLQEPAGEPAAKQWAWLGPTCWPGLGPGSSAASVKWASVPAGLAGLRAPWAGAGIAPWC